MTAFKKIQYDPIIEKRSESQPVNPENFRFLANFYWPMAKYGSNLESVLPYEYYIWPSLYYNSQSLIYQNTETTKYYVDFYKGNLLPVNEDPFGAPPEGDFSDSFIFSDPANVFANYYLYFVPTQERLFSVAWAHYAGSGSITETFGITNAYPSKAMYNQVKMIYDQHQNTKFSINDEELDHFLYVTLDQKTFTDPILPNTFVLPLMKMSNTGCSGDETQNSTFTFTDKNQPTLYSDKFGYYSFLVSGNLNQISSSEVFGTIYYDQKSFILNTEKLQKNVFYSQTAGSFIYTGSNPGTNTCWYLTGSQTTNAYMFGRLLRNSQFSNKGLLINDTNPIVATDFKFSLKNESVEAVYFLNLDYDEFNYTNNPSCYTNEIYDVNSNLYGKKFKHPGFRTNPVAYITSIGLYNDYNELVAIGKLPYPLKKDFSKRYSIKIVIKY